MNVLSLFDGISCGLVALDRSGFVVDNYYASEIDNYAIKISQKNHPSIKRVGDVTKLRIPKGFKIDLLLGGSPCQGFSFAGKQLNFDDPRSKLFFEYARILKECRRYNPDVLFLLENVSMKKEFQDVISSVLGVEPIAINSALVSAQSRKRLYWTNITEITQPGDKGIFLKDILQDESEVDLSYRVNEERAFIMLDKEVEKGKIGYFGVDSQANRVYSIHGKSVTLCGEAGGGAAKMGQYLFGCITPDRLNKRQNGQRFNEGEKFYTLTAQDLHGILKDGYIRKLTPIECERLQTLPDGYTDGISNSQRYKCLGNGWTVDVISFILSHIKQPIEIPYPS